MTKLLCALALSLAMLAPASHAGWVTEGVTTSAPNEGDILADTGAMAVAISGFTIIIWTESFDGTFEIVLRNALNTADVTKQLVRVSYYTSSIFPLPFTASIGQRIIVRTVSYPSGNFQASITW